MQIQMFPTAPTCCVCGRPLKNTLSIARGIGPVCLKRLGQADAAEDNGKPPYDKFIGDVPFRERVILYRKDGKVFTNVPHRVMQHSPAGFEFGYMGSGPADLALNILHCALEINGHRGPLIPLLKGACFEVAWRNHQAFKQKWIAAAEDSAEFSTAEIYEWLVEMESKE